MKILHCADLHIDSKMANLDREKSSQRKRELILSFERMVSYAKENGVQAIIIAGDMFDSPRVSAKTRARIFDIIKTNQSIDFLYLSGNHDEENIISSLEEQKNLKIFKEDWTTFDYGDIAITGIIFNSKNRSFYDTLNLDKEKFNIVVMHGPISKYNLKDEGIINLVKLKNKNIDYLALGHIHKFELGKLDERGIYCYSGNFEGRGFDECGEKGFVLLDINGKKLSQEFVPFSTRIYYEVNVDITGENDWFDIERKIIKECENFRKKDLIKVVLTGKYNLSLDKQIEHLSTKLNENFYFAKVKDESILEVNIEDFANDMSLRGEFIREVLSSELSDEEKEGVILIGLKALSGEEVK